MERNTTAKCPTSLAAWKIVFVTIASRGCAENASRESRAPSPKKAPQETHTWAGSLP